MSFDSLLTHIVTHQTVTYNEATPDDRGQPARSVTSEDVAAMVQPKTEREIVQSRSAGAPIGDLTVFMRERTITPKDVLVWEGTRLEILGIEHHAYGSVPHLEIDVRRISDPVTI